MIGASGCSLCTPCALAEGLPCRFPDLRYSCMSAYCIFVKESGRTLRHGVRLRSRGRGVFQHVLL